MDSVAAQIEPLKQLHNQLSDERMLLLAQIDSLSTAPAKSARRKGLSVNDAAGGIDYMASGHGAEGFEWSTMMKRKMKQVWGINSFRLCQEGVCNANMDGRDILCGFPELRMLTVHADTRVDRCHADRRRQVSDISAAGTPIAGHDDRYLATHQPDQRSGHTSAGSRGGVCGACHCAMRLGEYFV